MGEYCTTTSSSMQTILKQSVRYWVVGALAEEYVFPEENFSPEENVFSEENIFPEERDSY